jgi:hypothetical protein
MSYICIYNSYVGDRRATLKAAYEALRKDIRDKPEVEECCFYEVGEAIEVEVEIKRKQVKEVIKINEVKK